MVEWMRRWGLHEQTKNPPHYKRTLTVLQYMNRYYTETEYMPPRIDTENLKSYKCRLYRMSFVSLQASTDLRPMHLETKWPRGLDDSMEESVCSSSN
jgi:hypothetical protein